MVVVYAEPGEAQWHQKKGLTNLKFLPNVPGGEIPRNQLKKPTELFVLELVPGTPDQVEEPEQNCQWPPENDERVGEPLNLRRSQLKIPPTAV